MCVFVVRGVKWVTSISCALALTRLISSSSGPASEQAFPACASATEIKEKNTNNIKSRVITILL